jgi:pimeloyl-ACP methyl ester carboxylesterase
MLARLQQTICLSLLATALLLAVLGVMVGKPWLAPVFAAAVFLAYSSVLAAEFALLRRSYSKDDSQRPTIRQTIVAWAHEVACTPRIFFWRQPFRSRRELDHLPSSAIGRRGVILVHGFFCNRAFWNPWMQRLRAAGVPFVAVTLEPVLGSIDSYADILSEAAKRVERTTGLAPIVLAHSMGGLAVRAWLGADPGRPVHRVVTIASPHAGTRLRAQIQSTNMAQMREGSRWLADLAARESLTSRDKFTCFWGHCDNIVFPTRSAMLAGADNRHLVGTPHVQMAFHPEVFEEVFRLIAAKA